MGFVILLLVCNILLSILLNHVHLCYTVHTPTLQLRNRKAMSFLLKILFALIVFFVVGASTLITMRDVEIPQTQVVETVPTERLLNE